MKVHIVQIPLCERGMHWNRDFEFGFFIYLNENETKIGRTRYSYSSASDISYESAPRFSSQLAKGFEFIGVSI